MKMRILIGACLSLLLLLALTLELQAAPSTKQWRAYRGAWFEINYPPGFRVRPSLRSLSSAHGYDSAFFISPDCKAEFYVFSPQWNGEPKDIRVNPTKEILISQRT